MCELLFRKYIHVILSDNIKIILTNLWNVVLREIEKRGSEALCDHVGIRPANVGI